jgi:hypothetical protein
MSRIDKQSTIYFRINIVNHIKEKGTIDISNTKDLDFLYIKYYDINEDWYGYKNKIIEDTREKILDMVKLGVLIQKGNIISFNKSSHKNKI